MATYTGLPYTNYENKRAPASKYHFDADGLKANFNALADGSAIKDNAIAMRNLDDNVKSAIQYGIKGAVDNYADLPAPDTVTEGDIYIVRNDDTSGHEKGFYKSNGVDTWEFLARMVNQFLELNDTPADYTGQAGKAVIVNSSEDGVEFGDVSADDKQDKILNAENYIQAFDNTGNAKASNLIETPAHRFKNVYFNTKILEAEFYATNYQELYEIIDFFNNSGASVISDKTIYLSGIIYFENNIDLTHNYANIRFKGLGNTKLIPKMDTTTDGMFRLSASNRSDIITFDDLTFGMVSGKAEKIDDTHAYITTTDITITENSLVGRKIAFTAAASLGWLGSQGWGIISANTAPDSNGKVQITIDSNDDHQTLGSYVYYFGIMNEHTFIQIVNTVSTLIVSNCSFMGNSKYVIYAQGQLSHSGRLPAFLIRNNYMFKIRNAALYGQFLEYGGIIEGNTWYTELYGFDNTFTDDQYFLYTTSNYANDITVRNNKFFEYSNFVKYIIRWTDGDSRHSMRVYNNHFHAFGGARNLIYAIYFYHYSAVYGYLIANNTRTEGITDTLFTNATHDGNHKIIESNYIISK